MIPSAESVTGLILAAGRGSRLGRITDEQPKCLTVLAGRTLFDWQRAALQEAGVSPVTVVGGYRRECLEGRGCPVIAAPRWAETNMVGSLLAAAPLLRVAPTVVSYADIVYHPDTVRALLRASGDLVITYDVRWAELWADRFEDPSADAESFEVAGDRLVGIGERIDRMDRAQGQYMGLLRFTPTGWTAVETFLASLPSEEVDRLDMTTLLRRLIGSGVCVRAIPVEGRWCEVDSARDLAVYERRVQVGHPWTHDWRWDQGR